MISELIETLLLEMKKLFKELIEKANRDIGALTDEERNKRDKRFDFIFCMFDKMQNILKQMQESGELPLNEPDRSRLKEVYKYYELFTVLKMLDTDIKVFIQPTDEQLTKVIEEYLEIPGIRKLFQPLIDITQEQDKQIKVFVYRHLPVDKFYDHLEMSNMKPSETLIVKRMDLPGTNGTPPLYIDRFNISKEKIIITYTHEKVDNNKLNEILAKIERGEYEGK